MTTLRWLAMGVLVLLAAQSARADGWRSWVPFANEDSVEEPTPKKTSSTTIRSQRKGVLSDDEGPSMFARMGTGTRRFFRSTADLLTFKRDPEPQPVSGQLKRYKSRKAEREEEKNEDSSWFGGWFGGEEEVSSEPQTPQEFIGQPRPGF
jgi:hypothetical protein